MGFDLVETLSAREGLVKLQFYPFLGYLDL
jgi:hypothetical protein